MLKAFSIWCRLVLLSTYLMMVTTSEKIQTNPPITVIGLEGEKVELPCNITAIPEEEIPTLVFWYKDNITTPIYTLDARRGSLSRARHASSYKVTRVYFATDTEPAVLRFRSLNSSDQGSYRCRADFDRARTRYTDSVLKVIVPPQKPVIKDQNGKELRSLIGPYNEGEPLHLFCEVFGGNPSPEVTWWRESVLLDNTYNITEPGTISNELLILTLERHDLMAAFSCCASNYNQSLPLSSTVTVDMNFRPLVLRIAKEPETLSAGTTTKLECQAVGSRPSAIVTWWQEETELRTTKMMISVDGNITTSVLTFKPSVVDNEKILTCKAHNPLIRDSTLKEQRILNVHYAPRISINSSGDIKNPIVKKGHDVFFDCKIQANPWVTAFHWLFEDKELHTDKSAGIIISNYTLVLQKVDRSKRGRYVCRATNIEGYGESEPIHLRIEFEPVCEPNQRVVYGTAVHETVQVLCEIDADPVQVTFRWMFNNSQGSREVLTFKDNFTRSVASFIPQSQDDYGTLACWGSNKVGIQREPCFFTITAAGPPEKPVNCTVINVTTNFIEIGCMEGYNGGLSQHFVLELYETNTEKVHTNLTVKKPEFSIVRLPEDTNFRIILYAVNAKGRSEAWVKNVDTSRTPEKSEEPKDGWFVEFRPVLVTVVAGLAGLVFVIAVIIILVKVRSRKQRKKNTAKPFVGDELRNESGTLKTRVEDYRPLSTIEDERGPDIIPANGNLVELRSVIEGETFLMGDTVRWTSPLAELSLQSHSLGEAGQSQDMELPRRSQSRKTFSTQSQQEIPQELGLRVRVLPSSPVLRRIVPGQSEELPVAEGRNTNV
ncbi:nephrin-like [Tachypleus tridentatus]|uniref:nephrin-like n=1 Tax=Tachypleus tridentatus TaxID=6853 RepID=UPI003FD6B21B